MVGLLTKDYSQWLEDFLEQKDLAGKSLQQVLLEKSTMGRDETNRILNVIFSSLGEDLVGFEANEYGLPKELILNRTDGQYVIEIDWSPMVDGEDVVEKILVSIKDVTEIRKLRDESERQKSEMMYLEELAKIDSDKFSKFNSLANQFLDENFAEIDKDVVDKSVIDNIYINLHTLKALVEPISLMPSVI